MKYISKIIIIAGLLITLVFQSCYDEKMHWYDEPGRTPITLEEIPLSLSEKIARYGALKDYSSIPVGIGIGLDLYMSDTSYKALVDENFDVVTVGYHMKHAAMVSNTGTLNFTTVDQFFNNLPAGIRVFGHTLIWHENQNVTYLTGLIAPTVIAGPAGSNLLDNGDFETDLTGWTKPNPGQGITISTEEKHGGSQSVKMISGTDASNAWDLQLQSPAMAVVSGHAYSVSFYVKSVGSGKGRVSFTGMSNGYPWLGDSEWFTTSSEWTQVVYGADKSLTATGASLKLNFDMGYLPNKTYYIDDVKVEDLTIASAASSRKSARAAKGSIVIEKTDEEKAHILDSVMQIWIYGMVGHYKDKVTAWDVVNEPMAADGTLRTGVGTVDETLFYWQDYIGKDYAVNAFKYAREAGNANDTLFINDYNLEYSPQKLDGLIDYIAYIESKGVKIDGIGTQMHISTSSDTTLIDEMFQKLAATGKLIKISELDIKVETSTITAEQQIVQGEMYRKVVELYMKRIPEAQRYGITVWSLTDADSWIEDDAPCLWKGDYTRKVAYKGFADGLAGKDVSKDFKSSTNY